MRPEDRVRLLHMRDAAEAIGFATGRTREDFETDRQLLLAIIRDVEIVGEAASGSVRSSGRRLRSCRGRRSWRCAIVSFTRTSMSTATSCGTLDLPFLVAALEGVLGASDR